MNATVILFVVRVRLAIRTWYVLFSGIIDDTQPFSPTAKPLGLTESKEGNGPFRQDNVEELACNAVALIGGRARNPRPSSVVASLASHWEMSVGDGGGGGGRGGSTVRVHKDAAGAQGRLSLPRRRAGR